MLFQMQIPEMFSYVGMKDTITGWSASYSYPKIEERVKTEQNLATQAVYEHFLYIFICIFSIFHLLVLLLSILKYI